MGAVAALLSGCVTVTDSKGNTQTLGQFVDSFRTALQPGGQPAAGAQPGANGAAPGAGTSPSATAAAAVNPGVAPGTAMGWKAGQRVPGVQPPWRHNYESDPRHMVPAGVPGKNDHTFKAADGCRILDGVTLNFDVDTAYAKAMRLWRFKTPEALAAQQARDGNNWVSHSWKHDRSPGAFYNLWGHQDVSGPNDEIRNVFLGLRLSKTGPATTLAEVTYCVSTLADLWDTTAAGHQYYQKKLVDLLKS